MSKIVVEVLAMEDVIKEPLLITEEGVVVQSNKDEVIHFLKCPSHPPTQICDILMDHFILLVCLSLQRHNDFDIFHHNIMG